MKPKEFIIQIRKLVANNEFNEAIQQLSKLLENSPKLDEVMLNSARYEEICQQVRLGIVGTEEASLTKNQIRWGILELLRNIEDNNKSDFMNLLDEIELQGKNKKIEVELGKVIKKITQNAQKIYNIDKIDNANFS